LDAEKWLGGFDFKDYSKQCKIPIDKLKRLMTENDHDDGEVDKDDKDDNDDNDDDDDNCSVSTAKKAKYSDDAEHEDKFNSEAKSRAELDS